MAWWSTRSRTRCNILIFPFQHSLEEFLATEIVSSLPRGFIQALFDHRLGGNAGVVESRDEQRRLSKHTTPETSIRGQDPEEIVT